MSLYSDTKNEASLAGIFLRWGLIIIVVFGILAAVARSIGFANFAFWAPKVEQVRYNTFKESQTYNDGMLRDLQNLRLEYMRANPDQQAALKGIVLHRFSVYPTDKLPLDLQSFVITLQGQP